MTSIIKASFVYCLAIPETCDEEPRFVLGKATQSWPVSAEEQAAAGLSYTPLSLVMPWVNIGGCAKPDDNPLQAVIRETYEETGRVLDPDRMRLRAIYRYHRRDHGGVMRDYEICCFSYCLKMTELDHFVDQTNAYLKIRQSNGQGQHRSLRPPHNMCDELEEVRIFTPSTLPWQIMYVQAGRMLRMIECEVQMPNQPQAIPVFQELPMPSQFPESVRLHCCEPSAEGMRLRNGLINTWMDRAYRCVGHMSYGKVLQR